MGDAWISLPGPPFLAARSEPYLLGTWTAEDFAAYVSAQGAGCVVVDVAHATSSGEVTDALKANLEFPDWCASGWDSVHDAFEELRAAWPFPLALLVRGADRLAVRNPQLALSTVVRLEELSQAFGRAKVQVIVAYEWRVVDVDFFSSFRLSLQRALWAEIPPNLRAIAVGGRGGVGRARFIFDGVPGEDEAELVSLLETEVIADFEAETSFDFRAVPDVRGLAFEDGETWWAYVRRDVTGPDDRLASPPGDAQPAP